MYRAGMQRRQSAVSHVSDSALNQIRYTLPAIRLSLHFKISLFFFHVTLMPRIHWCFPCAYFRTMLQSLRKRKKCLSSHLELTIKYNTTLYWTLLLLTEDLGCFQSNMEAVERKMCTSAQRSQHSITSSSYSSRKSLSQNMYHQFRFLPFQDMKGLILPCLQKSQQPAVQFS